MGSVRCKDSNANCEKSCAEKIEKRGEKRKKVERSHKSLISQKKICLLYVYNH